jgi:hypothetical protein
MYGEKEFSTDVIEQFSGLIMELSEEPDMLHTQMGLLADAIRKNMSCTEAILNFIESILKRSDAILEIENAVAITFLELDELSKLVQETKIPPTILKILKEQQQRLNSIESQQP